MTLGMAVLLLIVAVVSIVLVFKYLKDNPKLQKICLIVLSLVAITLLVYIAMTLIFVNAVSNQPAA